MITLLLALTLQGTPGTTPEVQRDIVVIGNKLKRWSASVREQDGRMVCRTRRSSGDREIDAIGCSAMASCSTELRARTMQLADRQIPRAERKVLFKAVSRDLTKCVFSRRDTMIAELAERRFQVRQGTTNASN